MHPTLYPTDISYITSQSTFPFEQYGYENVDIVNQRSMSWMRSKFKITTCVQYPIDSHPFDSMSIHRVILIESTKTTSMEDVSTRVLKKTDNI